MPPFIAEDNPSAAERFVRSVFEVVERLIDFPESGRIVPEFGELAIREVIRKPCRIIYRVGRKMTEIRVSKIEAAERQIELSMRLLFQNEDPIGIHTLAAAGFRILRDLGGKADTQIHQHLKR